LEEDESRLDLDRVKRMIGYHLAKALRLGYLSDLSDDWCEGLQYLLDALPLPEGKCVQCGKSVRHTLYLLYEGKCPDCLLEEVTRIALKIQELKKKWGKDEAPSDLSDLWKE